MITGFHLLSVSECSKAKIIPTWITSLDTWLSSTTHSVIPCYSFQLYYITIAMMSFGPYERSINSVNYVEINLRAFSINRKSIQSYYLGLNTLRPRQNGRHFADDIFKFIFVNENIWNSLKISLSLKLVPNVRINNIPALVRIMAWHRLGDKPLSEPMMVKLSTHICVTRSQWVKWPTIDLKCIKNVGVKNSTRGIYDVQTFREKRQANKKPSCWPVDWLDGIGFKHG